MSGIPRLDKNASMLAAASGAVVVFIVAMMGAPVSVFGYGLLTAGFAALGWAAWSRLAAGLS